MALIGKIRQNFWIVLIMLALALASFILMDVMGSRKGTGLFSNSSTIGKVAGQKIDYYDFEKTERALYSGSTDVYGRKQMLWNYLVEKAIVEKEANCLGLGVSKEELMELQFGPNLSPVIRNNFGNPQTGQVDMQNLQQYKQAFETGQEMNPEFRSFWAEQEKQIKMTAVQNKINSLINKSMIVPKWQAEVMNGMNNDQYKIQYVKVGFDKINDSEIKLTDDDYSKYLQLNKGKYTQPDETRMIDYLSFPLVASKSDSLEYINSLIALRANFASSTNDSLFVESNGGRISPSYQKLADITGALKDSLGKMSIGSVVGPYFSNGTYTLSKLIGKRVLADSVKARHILREAKSAPQLVIARKEIDSLKNLLIAGRARFDSLAIRNSQDPGSGAKGGDLGTFAQGLMVKPFNDACFISGKPGGLYVVETQFGVHLIEVQNQKFVDKNPKYLFANISQQVLAKSVTQNALYDKISAFVSKLKKTDDLANVSKDFPDVKVQTSTGLKQNDFNIQGLQGNDVSRGIIKWAYKADKGDVSKIIHSFTDPNSQTVTSYVVTGLRSVNPPGLMSVEEAKKNLEALVKNYKKGELIKAKITTSDLAAVASQFGTIIDTANVSLASPMLPGTQASEPTVVAKASNLQVGSVTKAIVGNAGVYVAKLVDKAANSQTANLEMVKSTIANSLRQQSGYRAWDALKKVYKPVDNRSKFY